ncbi:sodium/hydrogen exchanger 9B2-like [Ciona intestinalis]
MAENVSGNDGMENVNFDYMNEYDHKFAISAEPSIQEESHREDDEESHHHHEELPEHYEYHLNKGSQHHTKDPIDLDVHGEEPGCGLDSDKWYGKCAIFWGNHLECPSLAKFEIGLKRVSSRIMMGILFWAFFWSITALGGRYALPGGSLFGILMVFLFGIVAENLIVLIPLPFNLPPLPPLLASLFTGIILANASGIAVAKAIDPDWSFTLRQMALGVILGEAGVEVDKEMMRKLKTVVPRLSFSPCIIEALSYGVFSHLILGLPWIWSFMLGFVCGAVAPACVVPSMIKFQARGLGVAHGVPTLLMAAASIDDIIAINGFNILLTIPFSDGGIGYDILTACFEVFFGIIFGLFCGLLMWFFPDPRQHNIVRDRTVLLIGTSWFLIFVTNIIEVPGSGTLGTLTCSFVASIGWPGEQVEEVGKIYKSLWFMFQPLLFGLTGANVNLSEMDGHTVGLTVATMIICLTIRLTVAGNAVSFLGWTHKEKFLTSIAWIPKATVQAAIGGTALDYTHTLCDGLVWPPLCSNGTATPTANYAGINATEQTYLTSNTTWNATTMALTTKPTTTTTTTTTLETTINGTQPYHTTPEPDCVENYDDYPATPTQCANYFEYATIILQVSVIVIIFTAPIGVFLIGLAGPKLLTVGSPDDEENANSKNNSDEIEMGSMDEKKEGYGNDKVFESDESIGGATPPPIYEQVGETIEKTHL